MYGKNFHCITNTAYTAGTSLVLTMTNTSNVGNKDHFDFVVNKCLSNVVTGAPVQVYITGINGQGAIPVYTKFGQIYPLFSDLLANEYRRGVLHGDYVSDGTTSYVILNDVPRCNCANVTGGSAPVAAAAAATPTAQEKAYGNISKID